MPDISSAEARPWDTITVDLSAGSNWTAQTAPEWCREVTVFNPNAEVVYLSKSETGTFAADDAMVPIPSNQALTVDLTAGRGPALDAATRTFSLASAGARAHVYLRG